MSRYSSKNRNGKLSSRKRKVYKEQPIRNGATLSGLMKRVKEVAKSTTPPPPPHAAADSLVPEQKVTLGNGRKLEIGGLRDEYDTQYVWCRLGKRLALIPYADWHGGGSDASAALRRHRLIIVGSMGEVREAVDKLKRFPRGAIVIEPGWSQYGFALPDGRVMVAAGQPEPLRVYEPTTGMLGQGGTLEGWVERVAGPLADHQIAAFFMMMIFAAPLLKFTNRTDNFGFELCGEAGRGKSTLQMLIASAAGPAIGAGDAMYWRSLNATNNALEETMLRYNGMPLPLDEGGLVQGAGKPESRAQTMRDLVFRLAAGVMKDRFGQPAGRLSRIIYMLSTNVSIMSLGTALGSEGVAIADRLITVPLLGERPHGFFDYCPPSYPTTGSFADALKQAAAEDYGHALPAFLTYLADQAHRRPKGLRRRIDEYVARFVAKAGANTNDGSQKRVAEAIGLVCAAGKLAITAGVLPGTYKPLRAALHVYRLHREHGRAAITFDDRLLTVMRHSSTIDLAKTELSSLSEAQRSACPAFLYVRKSDQHELVIPVKHIDTVFPGWNSLSGNPDVRTRLKKSSDRLTRDRPVGPEGAQLSCYVFNIQDLSI